MSFVAHIHAWKSWVRINVTKLNLAVKAPSTYLKVLGLAFAHMYVSKNLGEFSLLSGTTRVCRMKDITLFVKRRGTNIKLWHSTFLNYT
jgi:hypothetical protein